MSNNPAPGLLFVVSAPSATGKTTVIEQLVQLVPGLRMSRSFTSRARRAGETDGVDYNFIDRDTFEAQIAAGGFLEWADVFGNYYGTSRAETERRLATGEDLVLVIDVQGARQVRQLRPETIAVFMLPPSFEVLEDRLRKRSSDPEPEMVRRLTTARKEVTAVDAYDYVVVNDVLERCVGELAAIVMAERAKLARRRDAIRPIIDSFTERVS
ncbi:MAG: guanylate kinase [Acidobacteria bacterium]|jgi:guanylate kinase|nr:guanylate kinase [Acidobacteriota bacterium]